MPGMSLRSGLGASAIGSGGLTPVPAQSPTGPRASTAAAFGYAAGDAGPRTALFGCVGGAALACVILVYLWWSLPR